MAGVSASSFLFQNLTILNPGEVIEREISGGSSHRYQVSLPSGYYLRLSVEKKGTAIASTLSGLWGEGSEKLIEADYAGKQWLSIIAPLNEGKPSLYLLEIRSRLRGNQPADTNQSDHYILKIEEQRHSTARDNDRGKAERLIVEASQASRSANAGRAGLRQAVELYGVALALLRTPPVEPDDRRQEARTLYLMALCQQDLGENQMALESYLKALEISRDESDEERKHLVLSALGTLYFTLGEKRKAIDCYNAALRYSQSQGDRSTEAGILVNLGIAYKALGENPRAMQFYQLALTVSRELRDQELEATTLTNMARLFDLMGDKTSASNFYRQVLGVWRKLGNFAGEAVTLKNLGALLESTGQREEALENYRQALEVNQATGNSMQEAHIRGDLARVERDAGNLTASRDEIEQALEFFERQRRELLNPELQVSFAATNQRYYEFYIDLLMTLHDLQSRSLSNNPTASESAKNYLADAFRASESARMRALVDLIAEASIDCRAGVSSDLADFSILEERERDLRLELTIRKAERVALQRRKATVAEIELVEEQIVRLGAMHEQAQNELRKANPKLAGLIRPKPLSLSAIQQQILDSDSALLEYSLGEKNSYVWAISKDKVQVAKLPGRVEIEAQATKFYDLLTARSQVIKFETPAQKQRRIALADRELNQAAYNLSQTLLKPVAEMLEQKQLLIVADGVLNFLPFAALPDPAADGRWSVVGKRTTTNRRSSPIASQPPLLAKHEIINLPSASVLAELRRETPFRQKPTKDLAVVADPVFSRLDDRFSLNQSNSSDTFQPIAATLEKVMRSPTERDAGGLTRLPYSRNEAVRIAALAAEDRRLLALDFGANRSLVTDGQLHPYRYVHFATHGLLNSQSPELSGLVLSLVNDQGDSQLGVVRLGDIYKLNLSAELVVLSACRTGLGKEVRGEGLIGLTRGFMHAGVPRVIASLWSVDDAATAELMTRFYRELMRGKQTPAAALRSAQLSLRVGKQWQSPYFWAAFTLQGEPK